MDVLLRFSELCLDLGDLVQEIDVNPLILAEAGAGGLRGGLPDRAGTEAAEVKRRRTLRR